MTETSVNKSLTRPQKILLVTAILIIIIVPTVAALSLDSGGSGEAHTSTHKPIWHLVGSYNATSSGERQTDDFHIQGSQFKIIWNETGCVSATKAVCGFSFSVYSEDAQSRIETLTAPISSSPQSGVKNVNAGPGFFYVYVLSYGPGWNITIEDYY